MTHTTNMDLSPPNAADLRAWIEGKGITQSAVARVTGVNPRTARRWIQPPGNGHVPIPPAAWRLLLLWSGDIAPDDLEHIQRHSSRLTDYVLQRTGYGFGVKDDAYVPLSGEIVVRRNFDRAVIGDGTRNLADLPAEHPQMFIQKLANDGPLMFKKRDDGFWAIVLMGLR